MMIKITKKIFLLFAFLSLISYLFSIGKEKISKTEIKLGEKINLSIIMQNLENVSVLWEDMTSNYNKVDVLSKKSFYKNKNLYFEIEFTFFESGEYNDLSFTIPISQPSGEMLYLYSEKYNIKVNNPLSNEELETIRNIKEPSSIKLKKEKEQVNFPFYFSFYLKIILAIIFILIFALIIYYYLYKYIMKIRENDKSNNIPPYQMFLVKLEKLLFKKIDDRKTIEIKLSELTEILKELIYKEFSLNAPFETTNELINSLKKINFDQSIISNLNDLLNEIDMIKFAKAPINFDRLLFYINSIKELGYKIHNYKLSLEPVENKTA